MNNIEYETSQELFGRLNKEFRFNTDVCATHKNAKCKKYFTREVDGLSKKWRGVCWCNPPFDRTKGLWIKKAWEEAQNGSTVVVLCPVQYFDSEWWHRYGLRASELRFMRGRPMFISGEGMTLFTRCILLIFRPHCKGPPKICSIDASGRFLINKKGGLCYADRKS